MRGFSEISSAPKNVVTKKSIYVPLSASTPHEERATNSHIIFHKNHTRHHEPTLRGLPSFRVDGQSINIGNICRSMADRVSTYQYGDTTFVIVSTYCVYVLPRSHSISVAYHLLGAASIYVNCLGMAVDRSPIGKYYEMI